MPSPETGPCDSHAGSGNEERYLALYANTTDGVICHGIDGSVRSANPAAQHILGLSEAQMQALEPWGIWRELCDSDGRAMSPERLPPRQVAATGQQVKDTLIGIRGFGSDGRLWILVEAIPLIRSGETRPHEVLTVFMDSTESKQKDELIWRHANFDMLTGLPNRRLFRDRLEMEIARSSREMRRVALLFIDLDRFKQVNDRLGHAKGDMLLVEATARIRLCMRAGDTLARLGGDEFTLIVSELDEPSTIEVICERILRSLRAPFALGKERGHISASIGVTLYPDDGGEIETLLRNADQAMYEAKAQGRNRLAYFTGSMQQSEAHKQVLTQDLHQALSRGQLEVYFQPIVNLRSGRIERAEALLRWHHPNRGLVFPSELIPLAEHAGLMMEIGEWVFNQAIAALARWRERFGEIIQISVNKSALQFVERERSADWPRKLGRLGLPGDAITVEITETVLAQDLQLIHPRLREFRDRGIGLAIDDFGTGFSSLAYLKQFNIDFLKIDRSFIANLVENNHDHIVTDAMIIMAQRLGIRTIAEGVETEAQFGLLLKSGCDYAQGHLFAPALPLREFEALLSSGRRWPAASAGVAEERIRAG